MAQFSWRITAFSILALAALSVKASSQAIHVSDPKASFIDVTARRKQLVAATNLRLLTAVRDTRSCSSMQSVDPPHGRIDIPRRYVNGGHGQVDPRESEISQAYYHIQNLAAAGANSFLITGSSRESACVLHALDAWAKAKTLLNYDPRESSEAWDQVSWTVASLSLSVSIIEQDTSLDARELAEVIAWLHTAAEEAVSDKRTTGNQRANNNNLSYWRGLAATAAGIISGDDRLFTRGLAQYEKAINQLDSNGTWPLEMERVELALHYQSFALEPLVMIAELASRQGIDLYRYSAHGHTLQMAVAFLFTNIKDPSLAKKLSGSEQKIEIAGDHEYFTWLEFWNLRFPSPAASEYLTHPWFAARLSGSTTLYAAPPSCTGPCGS